MPPYQSTSAFRGWGTRLRRDKLSILKAPVKSRSLVNSSWRSNGLCVVRNVNNDTDTDDMTTFTPPAPSGACPDLTPPGQGRAARGDHPQIILRPAVRGGGDPHGGRLPNPGQDRVMNCRGKHAEALKTSCYIPASTRITSPIGHFGRLTQSDRRNLFLNRPRTAANEKAISPVCCGHLCKVRCVVSDCEVAAADRKVH